MFSFRWDVSELLSRLDKKVCDGEHGSWSFVWRVFLQHLSWTDDIWTAADVDREFFQRLFVLTVFQTGDKAFSNFLSDEIKEEKKIQKNKSLPKMSGGWELEMNGTEAKMTRNVAGEK